MSNTVSMTMANPKPEDHDNPIWQGYSLSQPYSTTTNAPAFDSRFQPPSVPVSYNGRPQRGMYRSLDMPSYMRPAREGNISGSGILTASPPPLNTHHSYPSLKRSFDQVDDSRFGESVPEFREELVEAPKPAMNQDHRLLSFSRVSEKQSLFDSQGRVQRVELAAQLHGMFFLSEFATPPGDAILVQPELTCYRRNLFQISGNVTTPRATMTAVTERGERASVVSTEVTISASESVDGHVVKLIVIPWKTPPPNSPEIPSGQEHEPTPIPLAPYDEGPDANADFAVYPFAYRRLQFRIATANNGRRRELQQHFTLHLNVVGTLSNGTKMTLCETSTAPIVVRGRSPRNFQARKEIPLVGSSSSRGNPPELSVSTTLAVNASLSAGTPKPAKTLSMELPRSLFTFDPNTIAETPSMARQPSYPAWNAAHTPLRNTAPGTPNYAAPLDSYSQVNTSTSSLPSHSTQAAPPAPLRPQDYNYQTLTAAVKPEPSRFLNHDSRSTKSPRHTQPPGLPSIASYTEYGNRYTPSYATGGEVITSRAPGYFPQSLPLNNWTTAPSSNSLYGVTSAPPVQHPIQQYEFSANGYGRIQSNPQQQPQYTWGST